MVTCYIGLGSNLGDRHYYIQSAIRKIMMLSGTRVRRSSHLIESLPQGGPAQNLYLNGVIEIETELLPYQLLGELQRIEVSLGRVRIVKNGPRTIDLDILTYGDIYMQEEALCIPHPRIMERDFVLVPLKELAPLVIEKIVKKPRKLQVRKKVKPRKAKVKKAKAKKAKAKRNK